MIPGLSVSGRFYHDSFDPEVLFVPTGFYKGRKTLEQFPNLKVVASNTTGDSHIDTDYCREHGIEVITLKGDPVLEQLTGVAELTIGLIVMLTRNVRAAMRSVENGLWSRYPFGGKRLLSDMDLGIIGFGRIGKHLYEFIGPIIGNFIYYDTKEDKEGVLHWMLELSDIITLHIPLEENEKFVNAEFLSKMKKGAYLVNTSRGEIVDEDAVIEALDSGRLAGYAADVLTGEFEPGFYPSTNKLWQYARTHDNVVLTPHIGGSTKDSWEITQKRIVEKVCEYLESSPLGPEVSR